MLLHIVKKRKPFDIFIPFGVMSLFIPFYTFESFLAFEKSIQFEIDNPVEMFYTFILFDILNTFIPFEIFFESHFICTNDRLNVVVA